MDVDGEVIGVDRPHRLPAPRGRAVAGVRRHRLLVPGQQIANAFKPLFYVHSYSNEKATLVGQRNNIEQNIRV